MNELDEVTLGSVGWDVPLPIPNARKQIGQTIIYTALGSVVVVDFLSSLLIFHASAESGNSMSWLYAALGTSILMGFFASNGIYQRESLYDRHKQSLVVFECWFIASLLFFWVTYFFADGLITSAHSLLAEGLLGAALCGSRTVLQRFLRSQWVISQVRQRILVLGWSGYMDELSQKTWEDFVYPCEIIGYVELGDITDALIPTVPCLGTLDELPEILEEQQIDVAFLSGADPKYKTSLEIAQICEREMVEFKVVPNCYPALASGMHLEWVSGVPVLGTDRLRLNRLHVQLQKRTMDILGALIGLILFAPIIAFFGFLVYRESPGPIFYRQVRLGQKGKLFEMIKIRSMRLDAEREGRPGWTVANDPRRLKIGAFMRKWNIDELPQFWNVLVGDMSLVGPRPERPELIVDLKHRITHYNVRHFVKPGLTGWAQVNGLRGDTDLTERIKHDLFYIDHWSLFLDIKTMILTLFKHKNAC